MSAHSALRGRRLQRSSPSLQPPQCGPEGDQPVSELLGAEQRLQGPSLPTGVYKGTAFSF